MSYVTALPLTIRDFNTSYDFSYCNDPEFINGAAIDKKTSPIINFELFMPDNHVCLPFYCEKRWNLFKNAMKKIIDTGPTLTFFDFKECIKTYIDYPFEIDFTALEALIDSGWMNGTVLNELLPQISRLALDLPRLIKRPIRLLRTDDNGSLKFNRRQIASLLANAFYSSYPKRDRTRFGRINFIRLFQRRTPRAMEKLKCLLHYFSQVIQDSTNGLIYVVRQKAPLSSPNWAEIEIPLCGRQKLNLEMFVVMSIGKIEDEGEQMTQLDFANEYIGGGVLGYGLVQEEIRFLICPELIVSCLVCEKMELDEAILIIGAERYSNYDGYDKTFRWKYRKVQNQARCDAMKSYEVLAIDALNYANMNVQFQGRYIRRELLKAYAGFSLRTLWSPNEIATGNWGCGAFGGNPYLKSMIQLMAAAAVGRPLFYFTFDNQLFSKQLHAIYKLMLDNNVTIGRLYRLLIEYGHSNQVLHHQENLFKWIRRKVESKNEDVDA